MDDFFRETISEDNADESNMTSVFDRPIGETLTTASRSSPDKKFENIRKEYLESRAAKGLIKLKTSKFFDPDY